MIEPSCTHGVISCTQQRPITSNSHAGNGDVVLGYKLMGALVLPQVPYPHVSSSVTADEFSLVGMNDNVVDGHAMTVVALDTSRFCIPDLDCAVLRTGDHPLSLTVEGHSGDVVGVALECEDGIWIG